MLTNVLPLGHQNLLNDAEHLWRDLDLVDVQGKRPMEAAGLLLDGSCGCIG